MLEACVGHLLAVWTYLYSVPIHGFLLCFNRLNLNGLRFFDREFYVLVNSYAW